METLAEAVFGVPCRMTWDFSSDHLVSCRVVDNKGKTLLRSGGHDAAWKALDQVVTMATDLLKGIK